MKQRNTMLRRDHKKTTASDREGLTTRRMDVNERNKRYAECPSSVIHVVRVWASWETKWWSSQWGFLDPHQQDS